MLLTELPPHVQRMGEKAWQASRKVGRQGRTVVLKLKTSDFRTLTRSLTPPLPPASQEVFIEIAQSLLGRVGASADQRYRLIGVGLSNFDVAEEAEKQPDLFG